MLMKKINKVGIVSLSLSDLNKALWLKVAHGGAVVEALRYK
jgi:non-homologous end joining protein Ku